MNEVQKTLSKNTACGHSCGPVVAALAFGLAQPDPITQDNKVILEVLFIAGGGSQPRAFARTLHDLARTGETKAQGFSGRRDR
jgi:hypothetical protein